MITVYPNSTTFLAIFQSRLEEDEITNALFLGLSQRESDTPYFFISSVFQEEYLVGLIAGKNMILSSNTANTNLYTDLILYMENHPYPGIIGPKEVCLLYSALYSKHTDKTLKIAMNQRIYACTKTTGFSRFIGVVRKANKNDINLLTQWAYAFELLIEAAADMDQIRNMVELKIHNHVLFVLEVDNQVVSMAQRVRPLTHSESVSLVYTPPHLRGNGYASAVVEHVTNLIIREGKTASLYTDLSNPTSNSIYMKIGYTPHCDSIMMEKV